MEVGGWVQVSLGILCVEKSTQNSCKPVLIFWSISVCIHLIKVVSYYDLGALSTSVMGFQKKVWMGVGGWVSGVRSIQIFFWIF